MSINTSGQKKKWYSVVVTVYRNSDGHILRDSQTMLIDGHDAENARQRAWDILVKIHNTHTHNIQVGPAELME